jgi:hypothetical protein
LKTVMPGSKTQVKSEIYWAQAFSIICLGGYSQNFLSRILKIFVTLTWLLGPIKH